MSGFNVYIHSEDREMRELDLSGRPVGSLVLAPEFLSGLERLSVLNCRLPLSCLFRCLTDNLRLIQFGCQTDVFFRYKTLNKGGVLDLSSEANIGGRPTHFFVLDHFGAKVATTHFEMDGGLIYFRRPGRYQVLMANESVPAFRDALPDDDAYMPAYNSPFAGLARPFVWSADNEEFKTWLEDWRQDDALEHGPRRFRGWSNSDLKLAENYADDEDSCRALTRARVYTGLVEVRG